MATALTIIPLRPYHTRATQTQQSELCLWRLTTLTCRNNIFLLIMHHLGWKVDCFFVKKLKKTIFKNQFLPLLVKIHLDWQISLKINIPPNIQTFQYAFSETGNKVDSLKWVILTSKTFSYFKLPKMQILSIGHNY